MFLIFGLFQVGWDLWDQHVITAVNDNTIKVWEAATGNLSRVLTVSAVLLQLLLIVVPSNILRALKKSGITLTHGLCFTLHFFYALNTYLCFKTEHSMDKACLFES